MYIVGFGYLRILAMLAITVQHGLSVANHYELTQVAPGCTIGQFGVAIFCGLAGWFAIDSRQEPGIWLIERLIRLFPAYWLVMVPSFALAIALERSVTPGLVLSQMLGLGYFTHGFELVNVVSWYISLILLCYGLTAVARWSPWPRFCMIGFSACALVLVLSGTETTLARHVLAFTSAAAIAASRRPPLALIVGLLIVLIALFQPALLVAGVALALIWLFHARVQLDVMPVRVVASYIYEYFLLHGLFLQAGAKLIGPTALGLTLGIVASLPAVILLKRFADTAAVHLKGLFRDWVRKK